jgi:hypothetical protein
MYKYLFSHFTGERGDGEQVYFAVSEDGLFWHDLNGGKPVVRSVKGECGVRDPFIVRHPITHRYYMMGTDLRIESGKGWDAAANRGSRDLVFWDSDDLVDWGEQRNIRLAVEGAGCAWAPESIYDNERERFFVFWASMVRLEGDGEPKQRIYGSYTDDFRSFDEPFVYMEAENHVIDLNIVYENGWYYRFVKDETSKRVRMDRVRTLHGAPEPRSAGELDDMSGVEGPQCYQLPDGRWCLIVDRYRERAGYLLLICETLEKGDFKAAREGEYCMGEILKRHGGVILVNDD